MAQPDDLEARVAALESQVRDLTEQVRHSREDSAAARILAGGADREVGELRGELRDFRQATTASFNAMREGLADQRGSINSLGEHMDTGFAEIRGRLDGTAAGIDGITAMLTTLIDRHDGDTNG
jgi:predicted  nucleic acid-binding Zn-ribbon protein